MTDQTTDQTTVAPQVEIAPTTGAQQEREDQDNPDVVKERKRRRQLFDNMNPLQKAILSILMFFFGRFLNAEQEDEQHGGHPEQDQRYQDLNRTFQSILGMDDKQYRTFKTDMRKPGADWRDNVDTSRVDFKKADDFNKNPPSGLLDLISRHESGGDYNIVYGGKRLDLTNMTVNQVLEWQSHQRLSAAGRYQIINKTLQGLKTEMHLTGNEKFDETMQDRMATRLLERRGLNEFLSGKISQDEFQKRLSQEWASLPKDRSNRSYYEGDGLNKALTSSRVVETVLAQVKSGSTSPVGSEFNGAASGNAPTSVLASNTPNRTPAPGIAPAPGKNA
jgi:muramidase (phage lysozyme)